MGSRIGLIGAGWILLAAGAAGCGGDGSSGGSSGSGAAAAASVEVNQTLRLEPLENLSAPPLRLESGGIQRYEVCLAAGVEYAFALRVVGAGQVRLRLTKHTPQGAAQLLEASANLHEEDLSSSEQALLEVEVSNLGPGPLEALVTIQPRTSPPARQTFGLAVHVAGDDFRGVSGGLSSDQDRQVYAAALVAELNGYLAAAGLRGELQLVRAISSADVTQQDPQLVSGGRTLVSSGVAPRWGLLGVPASDPIAGQALDVFLVQDAPQGVMAACGCALGKLRGGVLKGRGSRHAVVVKLFDEAGQARSLIQVGENLAHEVGHFLSLSHPTQTSSDSGGRFADDGLLDTPQRPLDTNADGSISPSEGQAGATDLLMWAYDYENVVQGRLTPDQGALMRGYLRGQGP